MGWQRVARRKEGPHMVSRLVCHTLSSVVEVWDLWEPEN